MARPPLGRVLRRAWRLRCPNCGRGRLFGGWLRMRRHCSDCALAYYREAGYFLGAMIINYIVTALLVTGLYLGFLLLPDLTSLSFEAKITAWLVCAVLLSLVLMRHSYSFWLALDFWIEPWEPAGRGR
ncbi:MAG TPA: DUF983 domain-containing protein [Candidatus Acidoferrales bacterium]|nr:DUF983 domain-containing protein [Candidatus Acidoferrales bacterium]